MPSESEMLKPCPFCGGTAELNDIGVFCFECVSCDGQTQCGHTVEEAAANWNRRSATPPARDPAGTDVRAAALEKNCSRAAMSSPAASASAADAPGEVTITDEEETFAETKAVTLAECPVGLFRHLETGTLALKTEYGSNEGRIDAYIVESGEFFWGSAPQTIANQRQQLVVPVDVVGSVTTNHLSWAEMRALLQKHYAGENHDPEGDEPEMVTVTAALKAMREAVFHEQSKRAPAPAGEKRQAFDQTVADMYAIALADDMLVGTRENRFKRCAEAIEAAYPTIIAEAVDPRDRRALASDDAEGGARDR